MRQKHSFSAKSVFRLSNFVRRWLSPGRITPNRSRHLGVEALEARDVPTTLTPTYLLFRQLGQSRPLSDPSPFGYSPSQVRHAYGFDQISFNSITGDGTGQTIAIVDAGGDPNLAHDLHQFDLTFGLPDPVLTQVNQKGGSTLPGVVSGWTLEISLDVEWAHAIAPGASILFVAANSSNDSDLYAGVTYAATKGGASVVSMSWGGTESSFETGDDKFFTAPGVTYVASSGDSGAPPIYPSASPNVLAVGGTSLSLGAGSTWLSESAWSGSGGGVSSVEKQPSYQLGLTISNGNFGGTVNSNGMRTTPDVAYDGQPGTGVSVYDSYDYGTSAPWIEIGGTSAGAPQWSALIAIADQGRALAGLGSLSGASQTLPAIYALPSSDFHDITNGTSTGSPNYSAGPSYDLATGIGTPIANLIVRDIIGPQVQVSAGAETVTNNTGSVALIDFVGSVATQTFTVQNVGLTPLSLSDPINLPAGFTLASDFGSTSLAPGKSTTFVVQMNTAQAASYSGTVSFGTNDPNNNPFSFTLSGTAGNSAIMDNGDSGYSDAGSGWQSWSGPGYYNSNARYASAGSGANTATWQFTGLAPGTYAVQADWAGYSGHASNASYQITANGVTTTAIVNQQSSSTGTPIGGVGFQTLATVVVGGSGTLTVTLSDNANGIVVADAVRLAAVGTPTIDLNWSGGGLSGVPASATTGIPFTITRAYTIVGGTVPAPFAIGYYASPDGSFANATLLATEQVAAGQGPGTYSGTSPPLQFAAAGTYYLLARVDDTFTVAESDETNNVSSTSAAIMVTTAVVIDNGQPGYSDAGVGWQSWSGPGYYNSNARYASAGSGANTATWQFTGLAPGTYAVQADWAGYSGHASNASYQITANGVTTTAIVNQQSSSTGTPIGGVGFQTLATVVVGGSGTLTVTLSDNANGIVVADAIAITQMLAPVIDLNWSGGGLSGVPASATTGTPFTVTRAYTVSGGTVPAPFAIGYYASPDGSFANATLLATEQVAAGQGPGTYSGSSPPLQFAATGTYYLLARVDDTATVAESDETNNVSASSSAITVTGPPGVIIDNGQAGYSDAGSGWLSWSGPGYYNNDARYALAGSGANTATWQFVGLSSGWYAVQGDWAGYSGHASNASYQITANSVTTTAVVNQQPASTGTTIGGVGFQEFADVYVGSSGTLTVTLSDKADGVVVADAIRVAPTTAIVIDNGQPGYSDAGSGWLSWSGPGYYNSNARYASAGSGANTATWQFTGLAPGTYAVQADWAGYSGHASNASYAITAGGSTTPATVNQQPASTGTVVNGVAFQTIATVTVGSDGTLTVTLSDNANGIVVADGLRVVLS